MSKVFAPAFESITDHVYYPVVHRGSGGREIQRESYCFTCSRGPQEHLRTYVDLFGNLPEL